MRMLAVRQTSGKLCVSIVTPLFFVLFAIVMAVVSAIHSFLIVAYAGRDKVAKEVARRLAKKLCIF